MSAIPIHPVNPPLRQEADGSIRIGASRVLLELVIEAFECGSTPEEIVFQYPSVDLADAYAVVAHYLNHKNEVNAYRASRSREAAQIRQEIEAGQSALSAVRARLLARLPA